MCISSVSHLMHEHCFCCPLAISSVRQAPKPNVSFLEIDQLEDVCRLVQLAVVILSDTELTGVSLLFQI